MYIYQKPTPLVIDLNDPEGFKLREEAANDLKRNLNTTGAERGTEDRQGFGTLAEITVRHYLGIPDIKPDNQSYAFDLENEQKIKIDVKCRGGEQPFREEYMGGDGLPREAKHNLYARQVYDPTLDTDIYLMTHLEHPIDAVLPGRPRQRKWKLYICGWISKEKALRDGVFLPRGSLTERGISGWFPYRGQEIEFYNKNLNGLLNLKDLLRLDRDDIKTDLKRPSVLNLTSVDAVRIAYDLVGRGLLNRKVIGFIKKELGVKMTIKPLLNPNQYHHLLRWLKENKQIISEEIKLAKKELPEQKYEGI